jgi:PIN domain-containing protein
VSGFVLDAGALIGYERDRRQPVALVQRALERNMRLTVPAGVVAQVWRNGTRQAVLAQLLNSDVVDTVVLDDVEARLAGQLCGVSGTANVVDASVVVAAQRLGATVVTSDPDDLRRLDPSLVLIVV